MLHDLEQLKVHILSLSQAQDFEQACGEWELITISIAPSKCPCGIPIKERCYIHNNVTGAETYVGNVCVNRFMQINTANLFEGLRRIIKDENANPNSDLVEYAYRQGYLYGEHEYRFLRDNVCKRKFSQKQREWKRKINRRIIKKIVVDMDEGT